jgi:hypothetical protein
MSAGGERSVHALQRHEIPAVIHDGDHAARVIAVRLRDGRGDRALRAIQSQCFSLHDLGGLRHSENRENWYQDSFH